VGLVATLSVVAPAPLAPPAAAQCQVTRVLRLSDSGTDVQCLENRLLQLGYAGVGTADSEFGAGTQAAVQAFQTSRGMYPDGVVYSLTARQLGVRGADPATLPVRVTMFGDSTMAAMRWYDEVSNASIRYDTVATGYDTLLSAESCRRLVRPSCVGRRDPVTGVRWTPTSVLPAMQTTLRDKLGQVVVIMTGYDDLDVASTIDPIIDEAVAQGVTHVFWLNYRLTSSYPQYQQYYEAHNRALLAARARHPELTVLDWNSFSAGRTTWFERDGIHLTGSGAVELGRFIRAAIDGRPSEACRMQRPGPTVCRAVRMGAYGP
jgi:peptidoglycan hydrolase-like protein with peptidoglycan-binding domain